MELEDVRGKDDIELDMSSEDVCGKDDIELDMSSEDVCGKDDIELDMSSEDVCGKDDIDMSSEENLYKLLEESVQKETVDGQMQTTLKRVNHDQLGDLTKKFTVEGERSVLFKILKEFVNS